MTTAASPNDRRTPAQPGASAQDLTAELRLVRDIIRRLQQQLDDPDCVSTPDDLNRLVSLIYSGARTVAYLLASPVRNAASIDTWLAAALDRLAEEHDIEL